MKRRWAELLKRPLPIAASAPRAQVRSHLPGARQQSQKQRISAARSSSSQAWRIAWAGARSIGFPPSPPTATVARRARTFVITLCCALILRSERLDPPRHSSAGHRTWHSRIAARWLRGWSWSARAAVRPRFFQDAVLFRLPLQVSGKQNPWPLDRHLSLLATADPKAMRHL